MNLLDDSWKENLALCSRSTVNKVDLHDLGVREVICGVFVGLCSHEDLASILLLGICRATQPSIEKLHNCGIFSVFQLRMVASVSPPKSLFYTGKAQNTGQLMRLDGRLSDKPGEA